MVDGEGGPERGIGGEEEGEGDGEGGGEERGG